MHFDKIFRIIYYILDINPISTGFTEGFIFQNLLILDFGTCWSLCMYSQRKYEKKQCCFTIHIERILSTPFSKNLNVHTNTHTRSTTGNFLQMEFHTENKCYQNVVTEKFWLNTYLEARLLPQWAFSCHVSCSSPPFFSGRPSANSHVLVVIVMTCNCPHWGSWEQDVKIIS